MDAKRVRAAVALLLSGPLILGAGQAAAPEHPPMPVAPTAENRAAYMAKVLPAPTLYEITSTVDGKAEKPAQVCMSAQSVLSRQEAAHGRARGTGGPPAGQGCTHHSELKPGGGMHTQMTCDKAAGARTTFTSTIDTDGRLGMRQHMEAKEEGRQGPRTKVLDMRIAPAGPCPADLKPGEMRLSDGRKVEAAANMPALMGDAAGSR